MRTGISLTANISSARDMFGRLCRFFHTAKSLFAECHFSVLWPLVGDVLPIIIAFIALALNVPSPSCMHLESEGAILHIK